jgi:ribosomal protein L31
MAVPSSGTLTMGNLNGEHTTGDYNNLVTSTVDLQALSTSAAATWGDPPDGIAPHAMGEFYGLAQSCFVKGTKVLMSDNTTKNIEDVVVGDMVQTIDGNQKVREVLVHPATNINGSIGFVTSNHPFYTKNGWKIIDIEARNDKHDYIEKQPLTIGDFVRTDKGWVEITSIVCERDGNSDELFYNLSIENTKSYYADGFLVHNKCFVGRTLINMADGTQKTIDKIVVGDMVDTISGSQEVTRVESPTHNNLVEYFTDGLSTICTDDHPFWSYDKQSWVSNNPSASISSYGISCEQVTTGSLFQLPGTGPYAANNYPGLDNFPFYTLYAINDVTGSFKTYTFSTDSQTYYADNKLVHSEI